MNRVISIALMISSIAFLANMLLASKSMMFSLQNAVMFVLNAGFYLIAAYAGLRLMISSR